VSIAAEIEGEVVAGVVLDAAKGVEYVAHSGPEGVRALRDGQPIGVRGPAPLAQRLIGTGFSYRTDVRAIQAAGMARLLPQIRDIRRLGSCSLDICYVAEGRLDGYFEEGVNLWDHAAAGLIARAAGARTQEMVGAGGMTLLICAPDHGFDELLEAVRKAGLTRE
jgi:myo-inositol-1(or 4)-monophosphatase